MIKRNKKKTRQIQAGVHLEKSMVQSAPTQAKGQKLSKSRKHGVHSSVGDVDSSKLGPKKPTVRTNWIEAT